MKSVNFDKDGFFNATEMTAPHGKTPQQFLELEETQRYIEALWRSDPNPSSSQDCYIKTVHGTTWFSPQLCTLLARWLNPDYAVYRDRQMWRAMLDGVIDGSPPPMN